MHVLGDRRASAPDIRAAHALLVDLGGVEHTRTVARKYLDRAVASLETVPESGYRDLLRAWAEYMVARSF